MRGYSSLDNMLQIGHTRDYLIDKWGRYLKDYLIIFDNNPTTGWKWKDFSNLPLPSRETKMLKEEIINRTVTFRQGKDKLIWALAMSR